ncbi:MAG: hypothetical protein Q8N83_08340 [Ignavibacteria bacterium]|nr:hypothetical protein [Ignavibacteria bacterium]
MWKISNRWLSLVITIFIIFIEVTFSQEDEKIVFPKVNHIASNAFYKGTFVTKSNHKSIPGSDISLPVITYHKFHGFEFRVSIIVREKGNISNLPVCVKLISPKNEIRMLTLTDDIAHLPKNKILDFSFPLELKEMGIFLLEVVSPENLTIQADHERDIVYYSTQIPFMK